MTVTGFTLGYRPALDGLRGIAALMIVIYHTRVITLIGGFIAVDIFFVLSGFLITVLLLQEYDQTGRVRLRNFYARRILRLAPALLLLLTCLLIFVVVFQPTYLEIAFKETLAALFYVMNWVIAFQVITPMYLTHTWSLSIEEQFYLLWPLVLVLLLRLRLPRLHTALLVAALALLSMGVRASLFSSPEWVMRVYTGLDTRADGLLIGCALAVVMSSGIMRDHHAAGRGMRRITRITLPAATLFLAAVALMADGRAVITYAFLIPLVNLCVGLIILHLLLEPDSLPNRLLSWRPLAWVGRLSYGLYLWHFPIFIGLLAADHTPEEVFLIGMPATFLAASLSYYLLERPVLRLKSRFRSDAGPVTTGEGETSVLVAAP